MKTLSEILPVGSELLGWTLLNSLWQGLVIVLLVITLLRLLPMRLSKTRYATACLGVIALMMVSISTFIYLQQHQSPSATEAFAPATQNPFFGKLVADTGQQQTSLPESSFFKIIGIIDNNMQWIMMGWAAGALLFSLRLISGWWYIRQLRHNAIALQNEWTDELRNLINAMDIRRVVTLAQSTTINSPMVIGFLKPVILIPAGMLAGLTAEQVETIIVHELAHIKRHDYIINLLQAFVETLFFFNPFVWILSNIIRREREYCCDDEVILNHGSSMAYARALAQLEEWRLTKQTFALSLAENKNQLLNRIRRIMEKSGQNYSAKDRLIPAVLLVVGLICASWLTIKTERKNKVSENTFAQDTVIRSKGSKSKTTIITFDEEGNPHEQIFESFDGDADDLAFNFDMPVPADVTIPAMPAFPGFPSFPAMDVVPAVPGVFHWDSFGGDTIPGTFFRNDESWREFSEEFEKKFKEEFKDFYKDHQKDFEKMMEEMRENFSQNFKNAQEWELASLGEMHEDQRAALAAMEHYQVDLIEAQRAVELAQIAGEDARRIEPRQLEEMVAAQSADVAFLERNSKLMEEQAREMELRTQRYETEVREMLIKDGYLGKDDKINTIQWGEDNEFRVNGKKIKAEDSQKYIKHRDKYYRNTYHFMKTE